MNVAAGVVPQFNVRKMEQGPIRLDYARAAPIAVPIFRLGVISISISIIAVAFALAVGALTERRMISPALSNLFLEACMFWGVAAFGTGVGGLFQRNARYVAILGILLSFFIPVIIPMFLVA